MVLIEDNRLARDRLAALLNGHPNFEVVATAACATSGLAHIQESKPHVALVGAGLGNKDSHVCVKNAKDLAPEARVILMDVQPVREEIIEFIQAGANGFILKEATVDEFVGTIRSVAQGTDVVPIPLRSHLLSYIAHQPTVGTPPGSVPHAATRMTKREREITDLVADGLTNKEIAQRLNIATYTVKSHVHNILEKLALHTRLQIAAQMRWAGALTGSTELGKVEAGGANGPRTNQAHTAAPSINR